MDVIAFCCRQLHAYVRWELLHIELSSSYGDMRGLEVFAACEHYQQDRVTC